MVHVPPSGGPCIYATETRTPPAACPPPLLFAASPPTPAPHGLLNSFAAAAASRGCGVLIACAAD